MRSSGCDVRYATSLCAEGGDASDATAMWRGQGVAEAGPSLDGTELSSDESDREDESYAVSTRRYNDLIRRALRLAPPDLDAEDVGATASHARLPGLNNGAGPRASACAPSGATSHAAAAQPRARRIYMHGFGAQITGTDIVQSLAHFGPVLRFRLFQDPVRPAPKHT